MSLHNLVRKPVDRSPETLAVNDFGFCHKTPIKTKKPPDPAISEREANNEKFKDQKQKRTLPSFPFSFFILHFYFSFPSLPHRIGLKDRFKERFNCAKYTTEKFRNQARNDENSLAAKD
jgi:hypothetical protein